MKDGPFDTYTSERGTYVLDGKGAAVLKVVENSDRTEDSEELSRRIAAALNAAETPIGKVAVFAANGGLDRFRRAKRRPARKGKAR